MACFPGAQLCSISPPGFAGRRHDDSASAILAGTGLALATAARFELGGLDLLFG